MQPPSMVNRMLWVIATVLAVAAIIYPNMAKVLPALTREIAKPHTDVNGKAHATEGNTIPTQLARVWFNDHGDVVGILFSTPQGDFFESRDGSVSGFIRLGSGTIPMENTRQP